MKVEKDEESNSNHWKDHDMETMISLQGEMEPDFLKNVKKQSKIFATKIYLF